VLGARPSLIGMKVWDVERDLFTAIHADQDVTMTVPNQAKPLTKLCGMSGSAVYAVEKGADGLVLAGFTYKASHAMNQVLATYADHITPTGPFNLAGSYLDGNRQRRETRTQPILRLHPRFSGAMFEPSRPHLTNAPARRLQRHVINPHFATVRAARDPEVEGEGGGVGLGAEDALDLHPAADLRQAFLVCSVGEHLPRGGRVLVLRHAGAAVAFGAGGDVIPVGSRILVP